MLIKVTPEAKPLKLIFSLDIFIAVLFLLIPMIDYFNYLVRGVNTTWVLFLIWFVIIIFKKKGIKLFVQTIIERQLVFILIFIFLVVAIISYGFIHSSQLASNHIVTFINYLLLLLMDSYYSVRPARYKFSLLFFLIAGLGIQAMVSIPYILQNDAFLIRLYSNGSLGLSEITEAMQHGVGNNGLYSSLPPIVILSFALMRFYSKRLRPLILCFSIAMIITVVISTFLASVLLLAFSATFLIFRFRLKVFKPKVIVISSFLLIGLVWFYNGFLKETMFLDPVLNKIEDFGNNLSDPTGRVDLAERSLETFYNNPFFGVGVVDKGNFDIVGEHLPWVDFLAYYGLFGFLPLFLALVYLFVVNLRFYFISDEFKLYRTACLIGAIVFFISSFISPMLTVPIGYTFFILSYTSKSNKWLVSNEI